MTVIIFIIVLAVLIFVHELGHFLLAKWNGIRVDAFAIGFGPKIISWQGKETLYSLNIIPFGGYVKIFGENPDEESISGPDSKRSFVNKNRFVQVLVLIAGVTFNFIFAWILYVGIFTHGVTATPDGFEKYASSFTNERIMITEVMPDSPAANAGLKVGDTIKEIINNSVPTIPENSIILNTDSPNFSVEALQSLINQSNGSILNITVVRNGENQTLTATSTEGIVEGKYAIGVAMQDVVDMKLPFFAAITEGANYTLVMIKQTAIGLFDFFSQVFKGTANFAQVAGPVGIAGIVGDAANMGFVYLLMITALISINLGVINLFPFPALDGGRILFVAIESIIRRRIPPTFANVVNTIGFVLLMILMLVITYRDIAKLF